MLKLFFETSEEPINVYVLVKLVRDICLNTDTSHTFLKYILNTFSSCSQFYNILQVKTLLRYFFDTLIFLINFLLTLLIWVMYLVLFIYENNVVSLDDLNTSE